MLEEGKETKGVFDDVCGEAGLNLFVQHDVLVLALLRYKL